MTIAELAKVTRRQIKIISGYNGKVLCSRYRNKEHDHLSQRKITSIDVECGYTNFVNPVLIVWVNGLEEYAQEHQKENRHD